MNLEKLIELIAEQAAREWIETTERIRSVAVRFRVLFQLLSCNLDLTTPSFIR